MKRIISVLVAFIILLVPVCALAEGGYITDGAGLLSGDELRTLEEKASQLSQHDGFKYKVLTVNDSSLETLDDLIDYAEQRNLESCVVLSLNMATRDYYIFGMDEGSNIYGTVSISRIETECLSYLSDGEYYKSFDAFLTTASEIYRNYTGIPDTNDEGYNYYDNDGNSITRDEFLKNQARAKANSPGAWVKRVLIWLLIGLAAGGITVLVMKSKMKTARLQPAAAQYVVPGSFVLTRSNDTYLYTTTTRTKIVESSSSSGGGGGSGWSGGGGGHSSSGHGGKF